MSVHISQLPALNLFNSPEILIDDNGIISWKDGRTPVTRTQAREQIQERLIQDLTSWDRRDIHSLMHILEDLETLADPGVQVSAVVDLSTLPTEPIPAELRSYPIWAMDSAGRCLAGAGKLSILPLSGIIAWFVTRKPGYCTRPDVKGCYLCPLIRGSRDCRNNRVFFPSDG